MIRLQIGHTPVALRHCNQHALQHACQQPVLTVGSLYASRQIRHPNAEPSDVAFCENN